MSEFEYVSCDENILQVLLEGPLWLNEIQRKTRKNKRYVMNQLEYLQKQGMIRSWKERKGNSMSLRLRERVLVFITEYAVKLATLELNGLGRCLKEDTTSDS